MLTKKCEKNISENNVWFAVEWIGLSTLFEYEFDSTKNTANSMGIKEKVPTSKVKQHSAQS